MYQINNKPKPKPTKDFFISGSTISVLGFTVPTKSFSKFS
jgi:hypothetical protein